MEELEREICELAAHIAAATCRWLQLVAEFDRRGGWADWGAKSCAQWLSWRCSIGRVTAREHIRVARRLEELPLVREAFRTGALSYCKVRAITRVAAPETEEHLVELGVHATGAQLEKVVRLYSGALAASTESAQQVDARRSLTYVWNEDGSLTLEARLSPDEGALVLSALKAAEADSGSRQSASAEALAARARSRPRVRSRPRQCLQATTLPRPDAPTRSFRSPARRWLTREPAVPTGIGARSASMWISIPSPETVFTSAVSLRTDR